MVPPRHQIKAATESQAERAVNGLWELSVGDRTKFRACRSSSLPAGAAEYRSAELKLITCERRVASYRGVSTRITYAQFGQVDGIRYRGRGYGADGDEACT
jgi:hypothetical protein